MNPLIERKNEWTCIFIGEPNRGIRQRSTIPRTTKSSCERKILTWIYTLLTRVAASASSPPRAHYNLRHPANPPGPAHHLSMGSIAREQCGRERTIHSFPNKQNHNLFLVSKFPPFFALPDVPRVNVPLRHRVNGKIWPTLFVCSVFLRVVVTPRRSLPCYVFRSPFRTLWHGSFLCVFWLHLLTCWR